MTKDEQKTVIEMRSNNRSYGEIAKFLGIGVSAIKMYCKRHNIYPGVKACKMCGKPLPKYRRKYCSDNCRNEWWKVYRKEVCKTEYHFVCKCCNEPFTRMRNDHPIYCSHRCYIKDRYNKEEQDG